MDDSLSESLGRGLRTDLSARLGIAVPVVQAPVGSAAAPGLAAAVSAAGGLGMLALTWSGAGRARDGVRAVRRRTHRPFGVNLVLDFPVDDILAVCLQETVPVVSTFWGDPASVSRRIRDAGALHMHTVGSVPEALHAAACGVDVIVAQGWEAGGHVRGTTTTMVLVPAVADAVHPIPVMAAGGIADGRGVAAALALGAQGVWLGTRFLTATQARTHPRYRERLLAAGADDTVHTRCFDGGWPGAPHRALRNTTVQRWEAAGCPPAPGRPGEGDVLTVDDEGRPHRRYEDLIPLPGMTGDVADMALYAGQSVALVRDIRPAESLVSELTAQTLDVIAGLRRTARP
ncbi:NAD(P)H-dependent flavin oxidoreductase [Couchioplanes azureus]|uniref:NAD(P)H-dependent flavin oxidoreductase n=1 Tax=Couchioplanes caeruleus TaxID=56438 RepID=UPI0019A3ADD0|nr:nitronate monooxygenase [Couchioplanes caeruleus]GGQ51540.1 2-nitropropane dioxygenase [Couchioplanes caeruleus subsp. azureus]